MNSTALQRIAENKKSKSRSLDLSELELTQIPTEIRDFHWLESLLLSSNQISKIEGLENLVNLNELSLYKNQISKIEGLETLVQLKALYIFANQISKIERLETLIQLEILFLSSNQISKIEGLEKLIQLGVLVLSINQISKIEGLEKLKELQVFQLSNNQISKIEGLEKLNKLQVLDVSNNQISKIEGLEKLNKLEILELSNTKITDLRLLKDWLKNSNRGLFWEKPTNVWKTTEKKDTNYVSLLVTKSFLKIYYTSKKGLYVKNTFSLKIPSPEWVYQGKKVVLDYLAAAIEQNIVEMNEAKVMIVGRPHAGKTSTSIKLRDSDGTLPQSTGSTKGILVEDWIYEKNETQYTAHLWDFGGQDVQYAIHQFFMTQRAIYLLIDCTRDPENTSNLMGETKSEIISNYWLQTIKNLAKASPTFYIYNLYEPYSKNLSVFNNLERQYGDFLYKYPMEVNLNQTTKNNEEDIVSIREQIQEAIAELPNVGIVLPTKWAEIKKVLTKEAELNSHITLDRFYEICDKYGVKDKKSALLISRYFHEIGSLIHYSDDDSSPLFKLLILKRKWATEATYLVILDKKIKEEEFGRFTIEDVKRIWSKPEFDNMIPELLGLLQKFEICYSLPNSEPKSFLIPQSLPDKLPEGIDEHFENPLSIRYNYEFLPYGVVNRLTVRLHENLFENMVWKQGMVLKKDNGRALVEEIKNINKGYIRITVSGSKEDRWFLQKKIMEQLDDLNITFNLDESVAIQVPCTCDKCQESEKPHLHNYKLLVDMLKEKIHEERCGVKPFKMVKILDLIDHAFFTRPEIVEQSLKSKMDFSGAKIEKLIVGDSHEKNIKAKENSTVQIADSGGKNESKEVTENKKTNLLEYFKVRKLLGWGGGAIAAAIFSFYFPILSPWSGLIFVAILGLGVFISLTSDSAYLRYSKWVLFLGLGAAGILNGLPILAGTFFGNIGLSKNSFIQFCGQYTLDEQPLITLVILVLTFALAAFLIYKDKK